MLSDKEFVINSLEQGLIITRLMIEHSVILEILLREEDNEYYHLFQAEKTEYQKFYQELLLLADNKVSQGFTVSQMIVTPFTKALEHKTKNNYKIEYDETLTDKTLNLRSNNNLIVNQELIKTVEQQNNRLLTMLDNSKQALMNTENAIITQNSKLKNEYIRHFLEETDLFIYIIKTINKKVKISPTFAYNSSFNFNSATWDHLVYLKSVLESEIGLLKLVDNYSEVSKKLIAKFDNDISPLKMNNLLNESMTLIGDFLILINTIITLYLNKNDNSTIPLFLDHFLKESIYFLSLLGHFKNNQ